MGYYKTVRKWVPAHYERVNGIRAYVRGYYTTVRIYFPTRSNNKRKQKLGVKNMRKGENDGNKTRI